MAHGQPAGTKNMEIITYTEGSKIDIESLSNLYSDAGWSAYTNNMEELRSALINSLYVLAAKEGNKLVGLVRVIGDGLTITYVQDLLVLKAYKRRKIGTTLMTMVLEKFKSSRRIVLLTDDTAETRCFYEAIGFESCDKGEIVAFIKQANR